jgi:hypothetical protein
MWLEWLDFGELLLVVALVLMALMVAIEAHGRRRERELLAATIEAEYRFYCRLGRL